MIGALLVTGILVTGARNVLYLWRWEFWYDAYRRRRLLRAHAPAACSDRTFAAVIVLGISVSPIRYSTFRFLQPWAATASGVRVFRCGPASIREFRASRT